MVGRWIAVMVLVLAVGIVGCSAGTDAGPTVISTASPVSTATPTPVASPPPKPTPTITPSPDPTPSPTLPRTHTPAPTPEPATNPSPPDNPVSEIILPTPDQIVVSPSKPYPHTLQAIHSQGDFTFNEVSAFGSYTVANIEAADLDGDGDVDLIVSSEENDSIIQVYENLGDAVFRNSGNTFEFQSPDERHWNFGIAVADFNGDSMLDIATADAWAGLNIYFNCGELRFTWVQNFVFDGMGEVKGLASSDLDNDGDIDIILGDHNGDNRGDRILFNDGSGRMIDSGQSIGWDITWDIFVADVNRDGAPDYISVNRYAYEPSSVHLNNGAGFFETTYDIPDALDDSHDIDGFTYSNHTYIFIANAENENMRQNRILIFDEVGDLVDDRRFGQAGAETKDMRVVDFDSDGLPDLLTGNFNGGAIGYVSTIGDTGLLEFEEEVTFLSIQGISRIVCEDFNSDGLFDFVIGIQSAGQMAHGKYEYLLLLQEAL